MNILSKLAITILLLRTFGESDISLRVTRSAPPVHPLFTVTGGLTVAEVAVEKESGRVLTRILHGEIPFIGTALTSLAHWRFEVPPNAGIARTSVTFLFRPATIHSVKVLVQPVKSWSPTEDAPALPREIHDPGYPAEL